MINAISATDVVVDTTLDSSGKATATMTFTGATAADATKAKVGALITTPAGYTLAVTGTEAVAGTPGIYTFTFTEDSPTATTTAKTFTIVVTVTVNP